MKALVYEKPGRVNASIKEIAMPECGDHQVRIRVKSCGICKPAELSHDNNGSVLGKYPAIPGHELSGEVECVGKNVKKIHIGDRVTVDNGVPCGKCYFCKTGKPFLCEDFGSMGHNLQGGMAEYLVADETKVYQLPENVSYDEAALSELIGCCLRAVERSRISCGETVLIIGAGSSGNILTQLYLAMGTTKVVVIDYVQSKLDILQEKGAVGYLLEPGEEDAVLKKIKAEYPHGLDIIVDACGITSFTEKAMGLLLKKGGTYVGYSFPKDKASFELPTANFIVNEWTYVGSTFNSEFEKCLQLIAAGKVDCKCMITGHYDLGHYFDALDENVKNEHSIKVIIHP